MSSHLSARLHLLQQLALQVCVNKYHYCNNLQQCCVRIKKYVLCKEINWDAFASLHRLEFYSCFLARDAVYTSRAYATMSVSVCWYICLSVTEVHWCIIANLGFKFRSTFTAHCGHGSCWEEGRYHRREEWRDHLALC